MTPTNSLTDAIIKWLILNGHYAWRNNTGGVWDPVKKVFRRLNSGKGVGDIIAVIGGRHVEIEIKTGRDKLRPDQIAHLDKVTKAGGLYFVVKNWKEFETLAAENGWAR